MRKTLEVLAVLFLGLLHNQSGEFLLVSTKCQGTYIRNPAIRAKANLRLVHIDEYPRVTQWTTTAVAGHASLLGPAYRLLVDQLDSRVWSRLHPDNQLHLPRHILTVLYSPDLP